LSANCTWVSEISPGWQATWLDSSPLPTAVSVGGSLRIQAMRDGTDCDLAVRSPSAEKVGLVETLPPKLASRASESRARAGLADRVSRLAGGVGLRSESTRRPFQSKR